VRRLLYRVSAVISTTSRRSYHRRLATILPGFDSFRKRLQDRLQSGDRTQAGCGTGSLRLQNRRGSIVQNRYVGDIGDYLKLGILRALAPWNQLGVAWWLFPDEDRNRDGRFIDYLKKPERWRGFDPVLFDSLAEIVRGERRNVRALEDANLLHDALFASELVPATEKPLRREAARRDWFERVKAGLDGCDFIFIDPDNGLEPNGARPTRRAAGKSVTFTELMALRRPSRSLLVYHHQTRRKGGHFAEIGHLSQRLKAFGFPKIDALRAKAYSPRVFFLLDASPELRQRAKAITGRWKELISWHSDLADEQTHSAP
jgi:hypothetical protein